MAESALAALGLVVVLSAAHVVAPRLSFIRFTPRSWVLSAASGVSVAYVFVHLLPEVAEAQDAVEEASIGLWPHVGRHAYVVALVGLGIFYGLERAALRSRASQADRERDEEGTSPAAFWISIGSFALYNAIVGYLVVNRSEAGPAAEAVLFTVAIALHFVVNDLGLREHHRRRYDRLGRPLLVAALFAGWAVGVTAEVSEVAVGLAVAFLGGGIILNTMKEELPDERDSRFVAFAGGAGAYSVLLLAV